MQQVELAPVAARERIEVMDVLRGFALLGILLMNMEAFVGPVMESLTGVNPRFTGADRWVDTAIYVLVQGKFFTLFSLLFGMGFAVMLERANAAGSTGTWLYARRLLALLGIGLAHAILVWSGDILLTYAMIGFVLLLFFRRTPVSRLPKWGVALYLLPLALGWLYALAMAAAAQDPTAGAEMDKGLAEQGRQMAAMAEAQRQAYGAGTWLQAVGQRATDTGMMVMFIVFGGGLILGMFLFGAWFVRSGAIRDVEARLPLYRRLRNLGFGLGLPLAVWAAWRHPTMSFSEVSFDTALSQTAMGLANVLLCFAYFASIVLAMRIPAWAARLRWFAPAGRMALTNYLLQSVICTAIFYGYGLGYFEQLPRAWQPVFTVVVFAFQVVLSRWWLARHRYGPMEWLWRWMTYGRRPPMRLASSTA